jgi:hypothetical protein
MPPDVTEAGDMRRQAELAAPTGTSAGPPSPAPPGPPTDKQPAAPAPSPVSPVAGTLARAAAAVQVVGQAMEQASNDLTSRLEKQGLLVAEPARFDGYPEHLCMSSAAVTDVLDISNHEKFFVVHTVRPARARSGALVDSHSQSAVLYENFLWACSRLQALSNAFWPG